MTTEHQVGKVWDWPLQHQDGFVNIVNTKELFEADLEVPTFKANEVDVKVMNGELVIHCSQDVGGNRMPREVNRSYYLPPDVDMKSVKTAISSDGILKVTGSKKH